MDMDPLSKITCINVPGDQPTYFQMINYSLTDVVLGDVVVLSNADQAFDDTISYARYLNPSILAVLSTQGFSSAMPKNLKFYYDTLLGTTSEKVPCPISHIIFLIF